MGSRGRSLLGDPQQCRLARQNVSDFLCIRLRSDSNHRMTCTASRTPGMPSDDGRDHTSGT